ncbi:MAG TPA: MarR family transcriptional regulator [Acidimicrobiales bacterium]|nr:MarR family transcriptional regulator [Acidimicrobiales bacterium]
MPRQRDADPLTDAEYSVLGRFRVALRIFLRFSEDAARAAGVTPNQHQLLLAIRAAEVPPSIGQMAYALQLRHHSTVELVDRAVDAGLVARETDVDDRRRQRLSLTRDGERVLASLSATHREELRRFREEMAEILRELG